MKRALLASAVVLFWLSQVGFAEGEAEGALQAPKRVLESYNLSLELPKDWVAFPTKEPHILIALTSKGESGINQSAIVFYGFALLAEDTRSSVVERMARKRAASLKQKRIFHLREEETLQVMDQPAAASRYLFKVGQKNFVNELVSFEKGKMVYVLSFWGPQSVEGGKDFRVFRDWVSTEVHFIDPQKDLDPDFLSQLVIKEQELVALEQAKGGAKTLEEIAIEPVSKIAFEEADNKTGQTLRPERPAAGQADLTAHSDLKEKRLAEASEEIEREKELLAEEKRQLLEKKKLEEERKNLEALKQQQAEAARKEQGENYKQQIERMEKFGIDEVGVARDVDNLLFGSSVQGAGAHFSLADKRVTWYVKFKEGLFANLKAAMKRPKFRAVWYGPSGEVWKEDEFTIASGNSRLARNTLKFDSCGDKCVGTWRVQVWKKEELLDEREFEVVA